MASWCGNCSGQDFTIDDSQSINLSAALQLGVEAPGGTAIRHPPGCAHPMGQRRAALGNANGGAADDFAD